MDPSVDLNDIARSTPGSSGADLENILNEAALLAARRGRSAVTTSEVKESCDKVRFGKERRSLEMDESEKLTTAYHESGHAITSLIVERSDPVEKVTIIPRGFSLGATHFLPKKNRLSYWRKELLDQLIVLMGGRAAEEIFVQDMSSGAQHDFAQATRLARSMICEWGMSDELGLVSYEERTESGQYLGMSGYREKNYSNETAQEIDKEVRKLLEEAYAKAKEILRANYDKVKLMTDLLMEFETLDATDVKEIMAGTWDSETKRGRMKSADELQRKVPPPPPIAVIDPKPQIDGLQPT
jgi:cell division protease FtsH